MDAPKADDATALLHAWRAGDRAALDRLMPLLYDELSRLAHGAMRSERSDHTLQTRALVNEAYLRLVDASVEVESRAHFLALAARTMRRVLTDHARLRGRRKRGDNPLRVDLTGLDLASLETPATPDALDIDRALERLKEQDERKADIVELHFYGGLNYDEIAEALAISPATVGRELRIAKAWLSRELHSAED